MTIDGVMTHEKYIADTLHQGYLAVLRTDTLYGVVALADDAAAVRQLQKVRRRDPGKAFILLIADVSMAYGVDSMSVERAYSLASTTRQATSVIVKQSSAPEYLLHNDGSVAYRVPNDPRIQSLLKHTGPLVAPSANPAGLTPARSIDEARSYFGTDVHLYVDDGETPVDQQASSVILVDEAGTITKIR